MEKITSAANDTSDDETSANPVENLLDLPPEIILQISSFLQHHFASSLGLSNKFLAALIGRKSWYLLASLEPGSRIHFLSLLTRDLPNQYECHGCIRLHLTTAVPLPTHIDHTFPPTSCIPPSDRDDALLSEGLVRISNYFSSYKIAFPHIQLAMRRHRHGPGHGVLLKDLSHTEIYFAQGHIFLFSVEARITNDELMLRSQEWFLSRYHPRETFEADTLKFGVCRHLLSYNNVWGLDDSFTHLLGFLFDRTFRVRKFAEGLHRCEACATEYKIRLVNLKGKGFALCTTKWINLGSGLTTLDQKWQGHSTLDSCYFREVLPLGAIRSAYESQPGVSVGRIITTNKELLSSALSLRHGKVWLRPNIWDWAPVGESTWHLYPVHGMYDIGHGMCAGFSSSWWP